MPATYEPIATTTLGADAATITFNSISSAYTDLRLSISLKGGGGQTGLIFNSDSATNYSTTQMYGNGTTAASSRTTSAARIGFGQNDGYDLMSHWFIDIFSYAGSTNKTVLMGISNDFDGSGNVQRVVGLWRSTSAITRIDLNYNGANQYRAGTTATLYGILKA